MPECRVLVTGPRDYADRAFVWATLDDLHAEQPIDCIIQGEAGGVDVHAKAWAAERRVPTDNYPADWSRIDGISRNDLSIGVNRYGKPYNKMAGFARNTAMLNQGCPTIVAVFPDPTKWAGTPGTNDMLSKARLAERTGAALTVHVFTPRKSIQ